MAQARPGLAPWAPTAIIALMIDCSPPLSLPPGHAHDVSDTHDTVPSGHFFAGQTATGVVLLCEMAVVGDSKHCTWLDLGSEERIVLMEALHASRCDHYFHWNASLARPRIVGRHGIPVRLQAHLLVAENGRAVELFAKVEGLEQERLLGVVAESKELAAGLESWKTGGAAQHMQLMAARRMQQRQLVRRMLSLIHI